MGQKFLSSERNQTTCDEEKLRELLVYVAKHSADDPTFGSVKLNKILYYADFAAYRLLGQPITGATYQKLHEGPAPRELLRSRAALIHSGRASIAQVPYFTGVQKRLVIAPESEPDTEIFNPQELLLVDQIIECFWGKTAREVSDFSHREPGWILAKDRETIPYETAWLSAEPLDQEVEELGLRLAQQNG